MDASPTNTLASRFFVTPPIQNAPMLGLEPLSTATLVAVAALVATVVALWIRPWWVLLASLLVAELAGFVSGILSGPAGLWILGLAIAVWTFRRTTVPWQRALTFVVAAVMAGLLAAHAMSGFHNPVVLRDVVLASGALPYSQYVNFDKTLAGVLVLAIGGFAPLRSVAEWQTALRRGAPIAGTTIAVVMAVSLALGFVRFDPRWTSLFWVWAPINLLLTCVAEEALFRGFLQREIGAALTGRAYAASIAVAISALGFGLAHAAGGGRYVLLSTLAGTGYAFAYQRSGRVEMSILTHFAVNATHFLLFTYPALA
jgi:membrane protease YdiL (CAAX protease family)